MPEITIYLIRCSYPIYHQDGTCSYSYKIGQSSDFKRRIGNLRENCPFAIDIIFTIFVPPELARKCEHALHIRYKSRLARILLRGMANKGSKEWFIFNDELAKDVVAHMKEMEQGIITGGWREYVYREAKRSFGILRVS